MLKTNKNLMLLALMLIPVLGFSQDSKNKSEEKKEVPSMIAIRNEDEIVMNPGPFNQSCPLRYSGKID